MWVVIDGRISVPFEWEQMMQLIEGAFQTFPIKVLKASEQ